MERDEFEASYATQSGISIARLRKLGLRPEPCDCGEDGCAGWKMATMPKADLFAMLKTAEDLLQERT